MKQPVVAKPIITCIFSIWILGLMLAAKMGGTLGWLHFIFVCIVAYPVSLGLSYLVSYASRSGIAAYLSLCVILESARVLFCIGILAAVVQGAQRIFWTVLLIIPEILGTGSIETAQAISRQAPDYSFSFSNILHFAWVLPVGMVVTVFICMGAFGSLLFGGRQNAR